MFSQNQIHNLIGLIGSATLSAVSSIVGTFQPLLGLASTLPDWVMSVKEYVLILTGIGGLVGVFFYTLSLAIDCKRKWREEVNAHEATKREAEERVCLARRLTGVCPFSTKNDHHDCKDD